MVTDTDLDMTVLNDLDFPIPCMATTYHKKHNLEPEPADYIVRVSCAYCEYDNRGYIGKRCLDIAWSHKHLACPDCKQVNHSMEAIKIITVL